jgi:hypothetical protein
MRKNCTAIAIGSNSEYTDVTHSRCMRYSDLGGLRDCDAIYGRTIAYMRLDKAMTLAMILVHM